MAEYQPFTVGKWYQEISDSGCSRYKCIRRSSSAVYFYQPTSAKAESNALRDLKDGFPSDCRGRNGKHTIAIDNGVETCCYGSIRADNLAEDQGWFADELPQPQPSQAISSETHNGALIWRFIGYACGKLWRLAVSICRTLAWAMHKSKYSGHKKST